MKSIMVSANKNDGTVEEQFSGVLDVEWEKVNPNRDYYTGAGSSADPPPPVFWSYRISPPFPSEWPRKLAAPLYYYVYAYGFDVQIADAERFVEALGTIGHPPWRRRTGPAACALPGN